MIQYLIAVLLAILLSCFIVSAGIDKVYQRGYAAGMGVAAVPKCLWYNSPAEQVTRK